MEQMSDGAFIDCQITEGYYKFIIPSILKQTRPGHHNDLSEFYKYIDPKICLVRHLDQYISRTKHMRTDESKNYFCHMLDHTNQSRTLSPGGVKLPWEVQELTLRYLVIIVQGQPPHLKHRPVKL